MNGPEEAAEAAHRLGWEPAEGEQVFVACENFCAPGYTWMPGTVDMVAADHGQLSYRVRGADGSVAWYRIVYLKPALL